MSDGRLFHLFITLIVKKIWYFVLLVNFFIIVCVVMSSESWVFIKLKNIDTLVTRFEEFDRQRNFTINKLLEFEEIFYSFLKPFHSSCHKITLFPCWTVHGVDDFPLSVFRRKWGFLSPLMTTLIRTPLIQKPPEAVSHFRSSCLALSSCLPSSVSKFTLQKYVLSGRLLWQG